AAPNQTLNYCGDPAIGAQCWYDNVVYSPPGKPNVVYLGAAFSYSTYGGRNNGRAFLRSSDAGLTFTDMTWDATTNPTPPGSCSPRCQRTSTTSAKGFRPSKSRACQSLLTTLNICRVARRITGRLRPLALRWCGHSSYTAMAVSRALTWATPCSGSTRSPRT